MTKACVTALWLTKIVCDRVVCERVVCDKMVCVTKLCVTKLCLKELCATKMCVTKTYVKDGRRGRRRRRRRTRWGERDTASKARTPYKDVGNLKRTKHLTHDTNSFILFHACCDFKDRQQSSGKEPLLPRKTKVDVTVCQCHACRAKGRWMSLSATPAMQSAAASPATSGAQARHHSQKRHACHARRRTTSASGKPASERKVATCCHACHAMCQVGPSAPPELAQCHKRHDVCKCHACHAKAKGRVMSPSAMATKLCVTQLCVKELCVTKWCERWCVCV